MRAHRQAIAGIGAALTVAGGNAPAVQPEQLGSGNYLRIVTYNVGITDLFEMFGNWGACP